MKEYVLNEIPIKTTNSFNVNNIKIKLDIPKITNFKNMTIVNDDKLIVNINENGRSIDTKIGLSFDKSYQIDIIVPKDTHIDDLIYITYNFSLEDILVDNINIIYEENSHANFILKYESNDKQKHVHMLKEVLNAYNNASGSISIINMLNDNSYNFVSIEGNINENAIIEHNIVDLGGNIKISNVDINLLKPNSQHKLNSLYLGLKKDIIDINYYVKNQAMNSINLINTEGVLKNNALKNFKGIIDFREGSTHSVGKEFEHVLMMGDECISRSLPMLLCHEEDVEGAHGVSSGKIDSDKLFYLMSRAHTKKEAERLIIHANFNSILNNIKDEDLKNKIIDIIDSKI